MKNSLTIKELRKTAFFEEYKNFFLSGEPDNRWKMLMLKAAILFLNSEEAELKQLGYRLAVLFGDKCGNYHPLYDISINLGYYPIVKLIERSIDDLKVTEGFLHEFQSAFLDTFKNDNYYYTYQQLGVRRSLDLNKDSSYSVVAPTSYGKSELIEECIDLPGSVCIIVPTKALLAQTKRRLLKKLKTSERIIVTHPEMEIPKDESKLICVLTQERVVRILQTHEELSFDYVYVDEAHNLLDDGDRSRLLALSIMMINKRNESSKVIYLTPFVGDSSNLAISGMEVDLRELRVTESLKSERFYVCDLRTERSVFLYDQFFNKFIDLGETATESVVGFVDENSKEKNIVYLNRPVDAQKFARSLADSRPKTDDSRIKRALRDIKAVMHEDYDLLYCLERGVVYHHGSIPDNIKLYTESLYSKIDCLKYIVTTSTLLEGVNIPAKRIFLLDNRKGRKNLTPAQFKNLFGRICRFKEVFDSENGDLKMLTPDVYIVGSSFMSSRANLRTFVSGAVKVDKVLKDKPENILLDSSPETEKSIRDYYEYGEFANNIEPDVVPSVEARKVKTDFGRECIRNNIFELDIYAVEVGSQRDINRLIERGVKFSDPLEIMESISDLFIKRIKKGDEDQYKSLVRLREIGAQNFYAMLLRWRLENTSVKEMVWMFTNYWNELIETNDEAYVYVGKWGEEAREGYLPRWVDMSKKTSVEKNNLAIVRIKDEFDFLDNTLLKFIEVLYALGVVKESFYLKLKYGTRDELKISLVKMGMSMQLVVTVIDRYPSFLIYKGDSSQIFLKKEILNEMKESKESSLLIHEARYHVR